VIKFNTLSRSVYTLLVCLALGEVALAQTASPQTVLNFAKPERLNAVFTVTNPTSTYADVTFTLYGWDGNPVTSGRVNPVRYRVTPKGQLSMRASEIFAAPKSDGWVQVTSPTAGLIGVYFAGDFTNTLEGSDSAPALTTQVVPVIRDDQTSKTELVVLNPGTATASVTIALFNTAGEPAGTVLSQVLDPHAALRMSPAAMNAGGAGTLSARITANVPVAATAIIERGDSLLFSSGQAVDQPASVRIAPQFMSGNGFDSVLILTNPTTSYAVANLTMSWTTGPASLTAAPIKKSFTIPPYGSIAPEARVLTGFPVTPNASGWLSVESAGPLAGLVIIDRGQAVTGAPLQTVPQQRIVYSQLSQAGSTFTGLALVNPSGGDASIDVTLINGDGRTAAQSNITLAAGSKTTTLVTDIFPDVAPAAGAYVYLSSSVPVYSIATISTTNYAFVASVSPGRVPDSFSPNAITQLPEVFRIDPGTEIRPGMMLQVSAGNFVDEPTFILGGRVLSDARQLAPGFGLYTMDVPAIEPGFANLVVRVNGLESAPKVLRVLPPDNVPTQIISGQAFYQKIDVTDAGLDLKNPVMVPARNARVDVFSVTSQAVVAVSQTDARGQFSVPVPLDPRLSVRVISRLQSNELRVADNTNGNALYMFTADIDGREPRADLLVSDKSRISGAFNILDVMQRANDIVKIADPNLNLPSLTVFWSTKNTSRNGSPDQGFIGITHFEPATNRAFILGDRNVDSDEFDDSVIAHEYGHFLAAKFSRDDSPGGATHIGDMLDPRVAWSEGWANFFSSVVRNDSVWRDSNGPNGSKVYRFDIEDNIPSGDNPGYWSESSVDGLLWDLYDQHDDPADTVAYPFPLLWGAFTDLRNDRFVYLPYFLEHFLNRLPSASEDLARVVQARSIDFQPNVRPSVTNPFPTALNAASVTGFVDSLSSRRPNLVTSSHFYSFTTTGGAASIRMDIIGLGPGGNANFNDLDIFLMDANGRALSRSDSGLNGQSELISMRLREGTYVIEIRSYYTKGETGGVVFNSGQYRLSVAVQ
jgi:hypothetical protein